MEKTTSKATMKNLNEHILRKWGPGIELVKGRGYFWFAIDRGRLYIESTYVYALKQMTYQEWVSWIDSSLGIVCEPVA